MTEHDEAGPFRVVIADASEHVRDALTHIIDDHPGLEVAGTTDNLDELEELCRRHRPHLAVVDLMTSPLREYAHELVNAVSPQTMIAVHTARADRRSTERLLASGIHAVYEKGAAMDIGAALHALVATGSGPVPA